MWYAKKYRNIYRILNSGGDAAWNDFCPINADHVKEWKSKLNNRGFLNDAGDKTPFRKPPKAPPLGRTRNPEMVLFQFILLDIV